MPIRFRPPRDIPDLGLTRGQQERFNAWLRTAFTEIAEDMAALGQSDAPTIVAQETIDVAAGSLRRVTPPSGGMAVRVPAPTPANAGQTVRLMIEAPVGDLTVVSVPGVGDDGKVFQPTINGEAQATFSASGLVTLTSNGSSDWKSAAEFAAESPATVAASSGGAALDAQYLLRSANALLPNARVASDSTEIDLDYTSSGLVSWFLKTASVAFSKLANLTGLSVLGRAANSAGVMAAITATGPNQALRSNDAGDSIGWERYLGTSYLETVSGSLGGHNLPTGFRSGDTLEFQLTGATTLGGLFLPDGSEPPDGYIVYLALRDQSGGSAPGHALTIPDAALGGVGQFRTPGQVQGTVPGPSYIMRSEEEGAVLSYAGGATGGGAWRILGGSAAQAIEGDILVDAGNGGTRTAAIANNVIVNADVNSSAAIAQTKLGAFTGFAAKASGSSTTSSAEPIITYAASSNMSAERVATDTATIDVDIGTAGQVRWNWLGVPTLDNAGASLGTATVLQGLDSLTITEDWAFSVDTVAVRYNVNQAADFSWSGDHTFNGATFTVNASGGVSIDGDTGATLSAGTGADASVVAGGDVALTAGDIVDILGADGVDITANSGNIHLTASGFIVADAILQCDLGGTFGGLLDIAQRTASPPSGAADHVRLWCDDTDPPTLWMVDENDVQYHIAGAPVVQTSSVTGAAGTIALNDATTVFRWTGSAPVSIQGFSGTLYDGRRLEVRNADGTDGDTMTLEADSASTATDGFHGAGTGASNDASRDKVIRNRGSIMLTYDTTSSRWYMEGI